MTVTATTAASSIRRKGSSVAKSKGVAAISGDQLPFDDADNDLESASLLMINRARVEELDIAGRARLGDALLGVSLKHLMEASGITGDVAEVEDKFQILLSTTLDAVESQVDRNCTICHSPFEDDDEKVEQHLTWVAAGRKIHGESTGESAHARCVKRIREGGDAGEKPLF